MKILTIILAVFLITACTPEKRKLQEGTVTVPPVGHIDLCVREPEHKLCKKQ
ncbi:MAG: hypothetical protein VW518_04940 [Burkholderiaceae bacterium]